MKKTKKAKRLKIKKVKTSPLPKIFRKKTSPPKSSGWDDDIWTKK